MTSTRHIGLALRPQGVELAEVVRGALSLTARVPVNGAQDAQMVEAIRDAVEGARLKVRRVAVSVPSQDVLLRFFSLPLLPKSEWEAAIKFEARKHIPFRTEELVWDYHAMEDRGQKQLTVVFAGIRKDRFDRVSKWLKDAEVEPLVIEPQHLSLARVVAAAYPGLRHEFVGVVELDEEAQMGHIAIIKGSLPYLARDVALGSRVALVTDPPVAGPEAGVWVAGVTEAEPAGIEQTPALSAAPEDQRAERLLSELRLSLDFFTREYPSAQVNRLLIYGGEASVQRWRQELADHLHRPVEMGTLPLSGLQAASPAPLAASSIGVALQAGGRGGARLDFLARSVPADEAASGIKHQMLAASMDSLEVLRSIGKVLAVQTVMAAAAFVLFMQVSHYQMVKARVALEQTKQEQAGVGIAFQGQDQQMLEALRQEVDRKLSMLRSLFEGRISVTEKLEALAEALPDGFWIEGFTYTHHLTQELTGSPSLLLRGACFLPPGAEADELSVIGEFSDRIKGDAKFFRGFSIAQLGGIFTAQDVTTQYSYRTFDLSCDAGQRL